MIVVVAFRAVGQPNTAVKQNGQLSISNGKVVNQHLKPPQLRGISMFWSIWEGKKYYNPDVINWLKVDFNVSMVRLAMAIEHEHGYLKDPEGQYKIITRCIDEAINSGLYVIVDWHDHHADQHLDQSKEFFTRISKRYAGQPNIIYEIFNEPEKVSWPVVKAYAIAVIKEIRKHDQKNLIVVGSPSWDQDVDIAAKDPITGFENIAYSFHFYASDQWHQDKLRRKADIAIASKLPLFITEWGVGEATGNGKFDIKQTEAWLQWMEQHQLSWANWSLADKTETTAILNPGASPKGGWKEENLSKAGIYIRTKLRKLNFF
ncbi:MAG: glycoside hydrolase family 5 protein [Pedobacter sp.]|nr:MAG: glycoside hydrolase family 5 protein [Pedobacter sp.]